MAVRPSTRAVSVIAGCAALAGVAAVPAVAASDVAHPDGGRTTVAGSTPAWATTSAKVADVDRSSQRHIQVALALRDPAGATALAKAVSAPGSPQHGHYLSPAQFTNRFAATQQTVDHVVSWLRAQGLRVNGVSGNRHFIDATAPVGTLEKAFGTHLSLFRTSIKGQTRDLAAPASAISLPISLRAAVTGVLGLDDSGKTITPHHVVGVAPRPGSPAAPDDQQSCARYWGQINNTSVPQKYGAGDQSNMLCGYTTPQVRSIYGLGGGATGSEQSVGIVGAFNLSTIVSDTNTAASHFGSPPLAAGQYSTVLPEGGFVPDPSCGPDSWAGEQALDVQTIPVAPAAKITYYAAKNCTGLDDALNTAVQANQVSVISNSWGSPSEAAEPTASRDQLNAIAVQAVIQGQAISFSSGDSGDNSGVTGSPVPSWPAASPWVTAVGGTTVALDQNNKQKFATGWESAANTQNGQQWTPVPGKGGPFAGGAGGGTSTVFDQPDYQQGVVPAAVAKGHRAVPDISALADAYTGEAIGFTTAQGYGEYNFGGTSLASPMIAGLVADAQQAQGIGRLGFLNPAIYVLAGKPGVSDVTPHPSGIWTASLVGYGGVPVPTGPGSYLVDNDAKPQSLQSSAGWDAVTGVGTPSAEFLTALGK